MTSVVKKILRGYQRVETDRIIAFRSHWGYRSEYCNPASGHEKGGVEGELGWFRRNWLVPLPEASVLDALNQHILGACLENRSRTMVGRGMTIGQVSELEREHLSPLAEEGFPIDELLYPTPASAPAHSAALWLPRPGAPDAPCAAASRSDEPYAAVCAEPEGQRPASARCAP
jgi:hypothetical protein